MKSRVTQRTLGFLNELSEYAGPFYYGASANGLGGIVFGLVSHYFNPRIPMPQAPAELFLRAFFGFGTGVAYSLGAFCFSIPYLDGFANFIDKQLSNKTAKDVIYSFLSFGASLFALLLFAYFLFFVYGGQVPVKMDDDWSYLQFTWFITSLYRANWIEVGLIPIYGILVKGFIRAAWRIFSSSRGSQSRETELPEQAR